MDQSELLEKLMDFESEFVNDPVIIELKLKLNSRFMDLQREYFTPEELNSPEMERVNEDYYEHIRELDPDDYDLFQIAFFM